MMKTLGNLSAGDALRWGGLVAVSVPLGFLAGTSKITADLPLATNIFIVAFWNLGKPIRGPSMMMGGVLGGIGGFLLAYQQSAGRLMGYYDNGR